MGKGKGVQYDSPRVVAKRVGELEKRLAELWRHESYLSTMVLQHLKKSGEDVPPEPDVGRMDPDPKEEQSPLDRVMLAVAVERSFQDEKWGPLKNQNDRDIASWVDCLREEIDEASDAFFRGKSDDAMVEMVQVAAVAFACLEQLAPENIVELVRRDRGYGTPTRR